MQASLVSYLQISSNWLIAELTHRQAHGLKLQYNPNIL